MEITEENLSEKCKRGKCIFWAEMKSLSKLPSISFFYFCNNTITHNLTLATAWNALWSDYNFFLVVVSVQKWKLEQSAKVTFFRAIKGNKTCVFMNVCICIWTATKRENFAWDVNNFQCAFWL